jgi:DNA-directed RNA polymerase subunit RPC12/RpoP
MAAAAAITCPECNKVFKGKDDLDGKKIRCPHCRQPFVVSLGGVPSKEKGQVREKARAGAKPARKEKPEPPPAKPPEPPPVPTPPPTPSDDDEDGGNPYGVTTLDLTARCPHCTKPMESEEAVVCLYCGYNTLTREHGHTEKVMGHTTGEKFMWLLPGLLAAGGVLFLILYVIYFCIQLPSDVRGGWAEFVDAESMRMWNAAISLMLIWGMGFFAYTRLVLHPKPPPKVKDE